MLSRLDSLLYCTSEEKWRNGATPRRGHKTAGIQLGEKSADEDTYRTEDKTERPVLQVAR